MKIVLVVVVEIVVVVIVEVVVVVVVEIVVVVVVPTVVVVVVLNLVVVAAVDDRNSSSKLKRSSSKGKSCVDPVCNVEIDSDEDKDDTVVVVVDSVVAIETFAVVELKS